MPITELSPSILNSTHILNKRSIDELGELLSDITGVPSPSSYDHLVHTVQSMEIFDNLSVSTINKFMANQASYNLMAQDRLDNVLEAIKINKQSAIVLMGFIQTIQKSLANLDIATQRVILLSNRY